MITEHDLQEAIAECQGKRNPDASTCIKLAAFYTIKEHLFPDATKMIESPEPMYSFSAEPPKEMAAQEITFDGETEFARLVDGKQQADVWPVIEELVTAVETLHPRLYNSFIQRLQE